MGTLYEGDTQLALVPTLYAELGSIDCPVGAHEQQGCKHKEQCSKV